MLKAGKTVQGLFITFEGIEGSGKTTQIQKLAEHLTNFGYQVFLTREPGDGEIGAKLRELLLSVSSKLDPLTELFLLAADRTRHVIEIVIPALKSGAIVISDRYADSSMAYQGYGRGLDLDFVNSVNQSAMKNCIPDLTIIMDIDPNISLERSRIRLHQQNMFEAEGRFEQENMDFHRRVRNGYLSIAQSQPNRCKVFDASGDEGKISNQICNAVNQFLDAQKRVIHD